MERPEDRACYEIEATTNNNPVERDQVTPQGTPRVRKIIGTLQGEMSRGEIIEASGLKDRMHFVHEYLRLALNIGLVEMTIPEKPTSRMQKYRLTVKGKAGLVETGQLEFGK